MSTAYDKIYRIDSKDCKGVFGGLLEFTEKIDGSQVGWGWRVQDNTFIVRSKGRELQELEPDEIGQFKRIYSWLQDIKEKIPTGYFFYGEYLERAKHNKINYARIPKGFCCVFAVWNENTQQWLSYNEMKAIVDRIGLDIVPLLDIKLADEIADLPTYMGELLSKAKPYLGGDIVEGIVVKDYSLYDKRDMTVGKLVSESFKEVKHKKTDCKDPLLKVESLFSAYATTARWDKAIQHCKDRGELTGKHTDIPMLLKELMQDLMEEEGENIKQELFKIFKKQLHKTITEGFADYYFSQE